MSYLDPAEDAYLLWKGLWTEKYKDLLDIGFHDNTVIARKKFIRQRLIEFDEWKLGKIVLGINKSVEFDETYIYRRKYHRGINWSEQVTVAEFS